MHKRLRSANRFERLVIVSLLLAVILTTAHSRPAVRAPA